MRAAATTTIFITFNSATGRLRAQWSYSLSLFRVFQDTERPQVLSVLVGWLSYRRRGAEHSGRKRKGSGWSSVRGRCVMTTVGYDHHAINLDLGTFSGKSRGASRTARTKQGSPAAFTGVLASAGIRISMDGRGRWMDNVFIERLWRLLKHEDVYLRSYADGREAHAGIASWTAFYNGRRPH
jgi:transposase InsO family protein